VRTKTKVRYQNVGIRVFGEKPWENQCAAHVTESLRSENVQKTQGCQMAVATAIFQQCSRINFFLAMANWWLCVAVKGPWRGHEGVKNAQMWPKKIICKLKILKIKIFPLCHTACTVNRGRRRRFFLRAPSAKQKKSAKKKESEKKRKARVRKKKSANSRFFLPPQWKSGKGKTLAGHRF
jgi:hypothetical protein